MAEAQAGRRADARRNRARVLEEAERIFAAKGSAASTEEIARAAGVGVGTVFRHFPAKEDLLRAVLVARMQRLVDEADALATDGDGTGLFAFFRVAVEGAATKNLFAGLLADAGVDVPGAVAEVGGELRRVVGVLLADARRAGVVRPGIEVADVIGLLAGTSRALEYAGADDGSRRRMVTVVLDGLRQV